MPCNMHNGSSPDDWIRDDRDQRLYRELEKKTQLLEKALCATVRWHGLYSVLDALAQNGEGTVVVDDVRKWYREHDKADG